MSNPSRRGPRPLSDILGELFTVRGYGRLRVRQELENAWNTVVGEPYCHQTRLGEVRRGVLDVTVAHSTLLEELAAFRKPALLAALRSGAPATTIRDIRFRVGTVALEDKAAQVAASRSSAVPRATGLPDFSARPQDTVQGSRSEPGNDSEPEPAQP